jgi:hypothetical protein
VSGDVTSTGSTRLGWGCRKSAKVVWLGLAGPGAEAEAEAEAVHAAYDSSVDAYLEQLEAGGGFNDGGAMVSGGRSRRRWPRRGLVVVPFPFRLHEPCFMDGGSKYRPGCVSPGGRDFRGAAASAVHPS